MMSTFNRGTGAEGEATELDGIVARDDGSASLQPGTRIGAYIIRHPVGEGGMGRVYLAEQTAPVRRDVALKLIREQFDSPYALVWFEVERQALAQMQHPAIAQIFDAGTTGEGLAFLAMEFVEGLPVTDYCREHALSCDQRLALFMRICQGVQHAHQKGVIHRDLKPANVLVRNIDGNALPKIIDFGIAIGGMPANGGPVADMAASGRAGTAVYMSPEQADLRSRDIDTRSDVYSLGVMLFEMLTDHRASSVDSIAYRSRALPTRGRKRSPDLRTSADEPLHTGAEALLEAAQELPFELQTLLRQALATDRNERYASASALADDVERYRQQRPLRAMPASRAYSTRKFVARHRLGIVAGTIAALALLLGTALAIQGQRRAEAAAAQALVEARKAEQIAGFVQNILGGINPDSARGLDRSLMRLVLDSAAERVSRELGSEHEVRAAIEQTIARSYGGIGEYALSAQHFAAALAAAQEARLPLGKQVPLLVPQMEAVVYQGKFDEALQLADQVLALAEGLPADDRARLRAESVVAWTERGAGKFDASIARYERVLAAQRAIFGLHDDDTIEATRGLAAVYSRADRFAEAKPLLQTALAEYRERYGENNTKTLDVTTGLAINYLEEENYAEAEALLRPALARAEALLGAKHPNTMIVVSNFGSALRSQGRLDEATPYYQRMLDTNLEQNGADHFLSVSAENNYAQLLLERGDLAGAERHARNGVQHADKAFGPTHPARAIFINTLGSVLVAAGKYPEAEKELDRAYGMLASEPGFGPRHSRTQDIVKSGIKLYTAWEKPAALAQWQARLNAEPASH